MENEYKVQNVSVIIPAYNEESAVSNVIAGIKKAMDQTGLGYEIIAVDDGSTDKTHDVLKSSQGISVITHPENKGYGASLRSGIEKAKYETIVIIDADDTYPPDKIPELLNSMASYDMVVAARTGEVIHIPLLRKFAKFTLNIIANYLSGMKIPDLNSGLRAMKKEHVLRFLNILPSGFSFTTTITLALLTSGYSVKYIPINYKHRKRMSKFHPVKDTVNMLSLIVRTILYFNPLKVFVPLGLGLIALGVFVLVWSAVFMPKILDATTVLLIMSGVQTIVIGLLADLIDKKMR